MINSRKIKDRAQEFGLRQRDIAKALRIKQSTVCQKINNVRPLSLKEAEALAKLLRIEDVDFSAYFFWNAGMADRKSGEKMAREKKE